MSMWFLIMLILLAVALLLWWWWRSRSAMSGSTTAGRASDAYDAGPGASSTAATVAAAGTVGLAADVTGTPERRDDAAADEAGLDADAIVDEGAELPDGPAVESEWAEDAAASTDVGGTDGGDSSS